MGHVYDFSLDQHGSRFIQQKLEGISDAELDAAFQEVLPHIMPLMNDVFGNYVVQKFLEHGSDRHRDAVAERLRDKVRRARAKRPRACTCLLVLHQCCIMNSSGGWVVQAQFP